MKDESFGVIPIFQQADGDRFLLIQHSAGHWGFPKGHADPGESPIAAARREFEEETGIQAYEFLGTISFVEQYCFVKKDKTIEKTVTYFPALVKSTEVICQEEEVQAYAWLPFQAALETLTFQQARQLLTEVQAYLQQHLTYQLKSMDCL